MAFKCRLNPELGNHGTEECWLQRPEVALTGPLKLVSKRALSLPAMIAGLWVGFRLYGKLTMRRSAKSSWCCC